MSSLHRQGMTAQDHREAAAASRKRSAESWERSDTDGFVSQWASDSIAREHEVWAELLDDGGKFDMIALFNLDGTVASTHPAKGQWGQYWVLNDAAAERFGKRFFNESKANTPEKCKINNARKGFRIGRISVNGYVAMSGGSGTGLSGAMSVRPSIYPSVDDLKSGNYEIVSDGSDV